jgi:hypothetical protein
MKLQELNAEEMKRINGGGDDYAPVADDGTTMHNDAASTYPVSDGVGQTNESTYGNHEGPIRHHIP